LLKFSESLINRRVGVDSGIHGRLCHPAILPGRQYRGSSSENFTLAACAILFLLSNRSSSSEDMGKQKEMQKDLKEAWIPSNIFKQSGPVRTGSDGAS